MTDTATGSRPLGVITHYNLLERLESDGPGDVYRARDTRLGRTVAIRWLPEGFAPDAGSRSAFISQARAIIPLSHPNVTTLFDIGEEGGRFLVFEFLKGQSLRGEMAGRPMRVRRALELAAQIADAVAAGHASGYVHGGLSPESVVITSKGHAKIAALELATRSGFERQAGDGSVADVRLRDYESPEEADGRKADDRSDIYSVGAMFYEMLTARRPSHRGAAAPSASNPQVPSEVDKIALKAVAPNPDLRYGSAATLASELRAAAASLDLVADADGEPRDATASTSIARVAAMTSVVVAVLALAAWLFFRN